MVENQQRKSDLGPSRARLRCLRCRSEVTCQEEGAEQQEEGEAIRRRMRKALMLTGGEEEQDEEQETDRANDGKGEQDNCLKSNFYFLEFSYFPPFSELSGPE